MSYNANASAPRFRPIWRRCSVLPYLLKRNGNEVSPVLLKRCADVDLGRWLNGSYAVASQDEDDAEDAAAEMERQQQNPH